MLTGDFAALGLLRANLNRLARVPAAVATEGSKEIAKRIEKEFATGRDPYGAAWKPLAVSTRRRGRRPPPLSDTREMRKGVRVKPMPHAGIGITFTNKPAVAGLHQRGARRMPARKILPAAGFPAAWRAALDAVTERELAKAVGGMR